MSEVKISGQYGHLNIEVIQGNVPAAVGQYGHLEEWVLSRQKEVGSEK